MKYEHTHPSERDRVKVAPPGRMKSAALELEDVDMNLRAIEMQHAFVQSMIDAGNFNEDPAQGPCVVGPPAWEDRNKAVEQRAQERLQSLEQEHADMSARRGKILKRQQS